MKTMRELINIINEGEVIDFESSRKKRMATDLTKTIGHAILTYRERADRLGMAYHLSGKLPLPQGTRLRPPSTSYQTSPSEVIAYYADPNDRHRYGYIVKDLGSGETYTLISNDPKRGLRSTASKIAGGWIPLTMKPFVEPVSTRPELPARRQLDPEELAGWEKEMHDLFGFGEHGNK